MNTERPTPETDAFLDRINGILMIDHYAETAKHAKALERERDEAREREAELREKYRMHHDEAERLTKIERAARVLIAAKGRHNTQLAYEALRSEVEG